MRGTLHFVAAQDVRWMLALLTPRIIASSAGRYRQLEIDDATFSRSRKSLIGELQGGRQLPRDGMYKALKRAGIMTSDQRGYHILSRLAQEGLLCFGAHSGKQPTFALLEEWVSPYPEVDHEESLARLALQYFRSHGPATLQDFIWWSGLKVADAKEGLGMISSQLVSEAVAAQTYWMRPDMPSFRKIPAPAQLLPGFDEHLLGYTNRSSSLDPRHAQKVTPGKNGMFMPTIVTAGQVSGIWKRIIKKRMINIKASPFSLLNAVEREELMAAAEQYGRFCGMPVEVVFEDCCP